MAAPSASSLPSEKSVATRISLIGWLMVSGIATPGPAGISVTPGGKGNPGRRRCGPPWTPRRICAKARSACCVRHDDLERRAPLGGVERDGPPMRLHDPAAEREPEAAPLGLGGEERFEDPIAHVDRNARTIVPDAQRRRRA